MFKKVGILWLAFILVACGGGGGSSVDMGAIVPFMATASAQTLNCGVGLNGDSITKGYGLPITPAMRLAQWRPKWQVTDRSVNGQAITEHVHAFTNMTLPERIQVIAWGTNDVNKGYAFEPAYRAAVEHVKASGRIPVMSGLYTVWAVQPQAETIRLISVDKGAAYAAWEQILAQPQSPTDGHPNQAYSDLLWGRVVAVIDQIMPECAN